LVGLVLLLMALAVASAALVSALLLLAPAQTLQPGLLIRR
jgi:hypothetical protein